MPVMRKKDIGHWMLDVRRGFTLVELLVVIGIIGILIGLSVVAFQATRVSARDAKRKADIHIIRNALDAYYMDHGKYPSVSVYSVSKDVTEDGWTNAVGGTQYYASGKAPVDPINRESFHYIYYSIGKICARMLEIDEKSFCLKATQ